MAPLSPDSSRDRGGSLKALDEDPSVVVDNYLCMVSTFCKVYVLQLAATSATEGKPDQHVAAEAE